MKWLIMLGTRLVICLPDNIGIGGIPRSPEGPTPIGTPAVVSSSTETGQAPTRPAETPEETSVQHYRDRLQAQKTRENLSPQAQEVLNRFDTTLQAIEVQQRNGKLIPRQLLDNLRSQAAQIESLLRAAEVKATGCTQKGWGESFQPGGDFNNGWPYESGQDFNINGPWSYDGHGSTVTRTPTRLTVDWNQHVPEENDPGPEEPRDEHMHIRIDVEMTDTETGTATVRIINRDDSESELTHDPNARVSQDRETGRMRIEFTGRNGTARTIEFDSEGDVDIDDHDHDLSPR